MSLLVWLAIAVWFSWAIAKERGVPWFRLSGSRRIIRRKEVLPKRKLRPPKRRFSSPEEKAKPVEKAIKSERKVSPKKEHRPPKRRFSSPEEKAKPAKKTIRSEDVVCLWSHPVVGNNSLPKVIYKLDELTRDRSTSERLVRRVSERNPGRSSQWCIEKAIYDIERDRMAR